MRVMQNLHKNEKGSAMVETAIAMPFYIMCIFFIPAIILFMFNMLGAHYASVITLREISVGPQDGSNISLEAQFFESLENNFRLYTTGLGLDQVQVGRIAVVGGVREVVEVPASCLSSNTEPGQNCSDFTIPSGGFLTISSTVRFINMSSLGLPDFTSTTLSIMRMNTFR
jgi:hypothetical protein